MVSKSLLVVAVLVGCCLGSYAARATEVPMPRLKEKMRADLGTTEEGEVVLSLDGREAGWFPRRGASHNPILHVHSIPLGPCEGGVSNPEGIFWMMSVSVPDDGKIEFFLYVDMPAEGEIEGEDWPAYIEEEYGPVEAFRVPIGRRIRSIYYFCGGLTPPVSTPPSQFAVWQGIEDRVAFPRIDLNPDENVITGMPVWYWYDGPEKLGPLSLSFRNWTVTVTAAADLWIWDMGDGVFHQSKRSGDCQLHAVSCPDRAGEHVYERKDDFSVILDVGWCGVALLTHPLPNGDVLQEEASLNCVTVSGKRSLHVAEVRGVLVG